MTDTVTVAPATAPAVSPSAPPTGTDAPASPTPATSLPATSSGDKPYSGVREAAQALARRRQEKRAEQAAAAQAAPPDQSPPPQAGEAAQPEAGPGETQEVDPVAPKELPSIEPPRSWKKEFKAAFEALPRDVQEQVAENERVRETDWAQRQNEVAQRQRAFEQELAAVQQTRQQYEAGLQQTLQLLMTNNEFADVQSMDDVARMAEQDWPRWARYQTHQQKVQQLQQQYQQVQYQNQVEASTQWNRFAEEQDTLFSEKVPNAKELREAAGTYLRDAGFTPDEMNRYWNSAGWRDHRMQVIIADAIRYRQAKAKADAAVKKPVPDVLKPGVSAPKPNPFQAQISDLESKGALSLREAAKLNQLRRAAAKA